VEGSLTCADRSAEAGEAGTAVAGDSGARAGREAGTVLREASLSGRIGIDKMGEVAFGFGSD